MSRWDKNFTQEEWDDLSYEDQQNYSLVVAVDVTGGRRGDAPQRLAEDVEDLLETVGVNEEWSGHQCDNCGNSLYRLRLIAGMPLEMVRKRNSASAFFMECVPDLDDDERVEGVGCFTHWRLSLMRGGDVEW